MRQRRRWARGKKQTKLLSLLVMLALSAVYYFSRPKDQNQRCSGDAACFTGVVNRVIDGDTLEVNGQRIRLVLVDAPERDTPEGPASTAYLRQLCPVGSAALVDQDDRQPTDAYGRMLAVVWCGDTRANEETIRGGHAELYRRFCPQSEFGYELWALALGCH